jgi:hypothetical protein
MLQAGRSWARAQIKSLNFLNLRNLSGLSIVLGFTQPLIEMTTRRYDNMYTWISKKFRLTILEGFTNASSMLNYVLCSSWRCESSSHSNSEAVVVSYCLYWNMKRPFDFFFSFQIGAMDAILPNWSYMVTLDVNILKNKPILEILINFFRAHNNNNNNNNSIQFNSLLLMCRINSKTPITETAQCKYWFTLMDYHIA